jgi:hypothetical protein
MVNPKIPDNMFDVEELKKREFIARYLSSEVSASERITDRNTGEPASVWKVEMEPVSFRQDWTYEREILPRKGPSSDWTQTVEGLNNAGFKVSMATIPQLVGKCFWVRVATRPYYTTDELGNRVAKTATSWIPFKVATDEEIAAAEARLAESGQSETGSVVLASENKDNLILGFAEGCTLEEVVGIAQTMPDLAKDAAYMKDLTSGIVTARLQAQKRLALVDGKFKVA